MTPCAAAAAGPPWPASLTAGQLEQLVLPSWRRVPSNPLCFRQNGRNLGAGRAHGGRGGSGESRAERWCWCWCWCWWHQWWFDGELWPSSCTSSPSSSPAFKPGSKCAATTFYHTGQWISSSSILPLHHRSVVIV